MFYSDDGMALIAMWATKMPAALDNSVDDDAGDNAVSAAVMIMGFSTVEITCVAARNNMSVMRKKEHQLMMPERIIG